MTIRLAQVAGEGRGLDGRWAAESVESGLETTTSLKSDYGGAERVALWLR